MRGPRIAEREGNYTDAPRSLRAEAERARRRELLIQPRSEPLARFVEGLRRKEVEVPDFDPLDGGTEAEVLFLFEKPGPMTALEGRRPGSGFVSRDNDDPTAEATFRFLLQTAIPRRLTAIWNTVPWWNGTRAISAEELTSGMAACGQLVRILPSLQVVVLVGSRAARLKQYFSGIGLPTIMSAHPSPLVRASRPQLWHAIPTQWAAALEFLR